MIYILFMQYQSLPVTKYELDAAVQQRKLQKMAHVVAPRNSKKRKHKSFECEIPIFKPSPNG